MGYGTIGFKKFPKKNKVYGDESFYITPITYGFSPHTLLAFKICPDAENGIGHFEIEGEWYSGKGINDKKKELKEVEIKFIYDPDEFISPEDIERVSAYCDMSLKELLNLAKE